MSLCVDLVLNHTAREHPWARGWLAGDPEYADFYYAFPDRTCPTRTRRRSATSSPTGARLVHLGRHPRRRRVGVDDVLRYQWDLNWANPRVFAAVLETILWLANRGIEIFRMDAVPFMWKRLGTSCMNQPEVHDLMQALHALAKIAAPAVVFKAEAIVSPEDLVAYLGGHHRYRPECELAYHNQLMVMLWSSLATKDARLAVQSLRRMRADPGRDRRGRPTCAATTTSGGRSATSTPGPSATSPFAHRDFLNDFYSGRFPLSYARGALFGENPRVRRRAHLRLAPRRCAGSARPGSAVTTPRSTRASAGSCCCTP